MNAEDKTLCVECGFWYCGDASKHHHSCSKYVSSCRCTEDGLWFCWCDAHSGVPSYKREECASA